MTIINMLGGGGGDSLDALTLDIFDGVTDTKYFTFNRSDTTISSGAPRVLANGVISDDVSSNYATNVFTRNGNFTIAALTGLSGDKSGGAMLNDTIYWFVRYSSSTSYIYTASRESPTWKLSQRIGNQCWVCGIFNDGTFLYSDGSNSGRLMVGNISGNVVTPIKDLGVDIYPFLIRYAGGNKYIVNNNSSKTYLVSPDGAVEFDTVPAFGTNEDHVAMLTSSKKIYVDGVFKYDCGGITGNPASITPTNESDTFYITTRSSSTTYAYLVNPDGIHSIYPVITPYFSDAAPSSTNTSSCSLQLPNTMRISQKYNQGKHSVFTPRKSDTTGSFMINGKIVCNTL